jgi:hypothetical protein
VLFVAILPARPRFALGGERLSPDQMGAVQGSCPPSPIRGIRVIRGSSRIQYEALASWQLRGENPGHSSMRRDHSE